MSDPPESEPAIDASGKPEKKPSWVRRMYDWTLSWADKPGALHVLFWISFFGSSFGPVPSDPLLTAMCFSQPKRWLIFGFWTTFASVLGAVFAWGIGFWFWEAAGPYFYDFVPGFTPDIFEVAKTYFDDSAFFWISASAFTPIPFKVFTIAAGVFAVDLWVLIIASIVGRGARFMGIAFLIRLFGPKVRPIIEKYLEVIAVVGLIVGILSFFAIEWLSP